MSISTATSPIKLFKHQKDLVDLNPDQHALIWETGTGKTIGALSLAITKSRNILIICPKGLVDKWGDDIKLFPAGEFQILSKEQFKKQHKDLPKFDCTIVDEAHYFFGTKSALMKSLKWYLEKHEIPYRYFLSGTPYRSTPMDIYVMCTLLGHKLNYWTFQTKFFYQVRMGMRMVPMVKKGIEKDIAKIVQGVGSIVKLGDCIDMPQSIFQEIDVTLTKEQKTAIDTLDATSPIVRYTKIHQICGGTMKADEYTPASFYDTEKIGHLVEIADSIDKIIVVCRYNHEIEYLRGRLARCGKRIEYINGEVSNRHEILTSLSNEERYVLIVNGAISEGWQLQNCNHMVFYSYGFELKNKIQMEGRLRRIDAPRPVLYMSLITKDTIDEAVYTSLKNKEDFHIAIYAKKNQ